MKRATSLLATSILMVLGAHGQDCSIPFTTPLFGVQEQLDIPYGTATRYNGASELLRLNLFKPAGDGQVQRPLLILVHGGGFTGGHRNDLTTLAREYASKGFATAAISYRLDFYGTWLLPSPYAYDPAEVVRAAYRAQQDLRGAIRFLKARSAQDSSSTQNVMLMGFSAGAIASLHAGFVDSPAEKPASCGSIGSVVHFLTSYPRPDLGPIGGTLNLNGQSDKVLAVVSYYGGLLETSFVPSPLDPALYLYHQTGDPVVGCNYQQGLWGMPLGVGGNYPWMYGSCAMDPYIQNLSPAPGRYFLHLHTGNEHALHAPAAIHLEASQFLRELFCSAAGSQIAARVLLEGPYDPATGLMSDSLRRRPDFPLTEPYTGLGHAFVAGGGETIAASVLNNTGNNAIVDWVVIELRDVVDPTLVVYSRAALLQRDGDVVEVDGSTAVQLAMGSGNYRVAVRHRNHLGAMTLSAVALSAVPLGVDLSAIATATHGTEARKSITGAFPAQVLWAGDVDRNGVVKYTGENNDRDPILFAIGGSVPTNSVAGYHSEDLNLDGAVKYTGQRNDRDAILQNIGGVVPTNSRQGQLP